MTAEAWIDELRGGACFPGAPGDVQVIQTHLSVVCLAGDRVYKLKKAVTLPFVDFAPLAKRRRACRDEVRLNRRLCPETYLGTASLRRRDGALAFAAIGDDEGPDDLDVAVVMRRLPQDRMLDGLVRRGEATAEELEGLARLVARFHASADRGPAVLAHGDPKQLAAFAAANFAELRAVPGHGLPTDLLEAVERASRVDFGSLLPELEARAAAGHVVDGHGDLHARNVCMTDPPTVYDCIEFEPAFRCGDVATEIAFLAMDLRYLGAPALARAFVDAYVAASGDARLPALLPPLCGYRAMVRAKVAALAAAEPELPLADRAAARASTRRHLLLAAAFAAEHRGPWWLCVCGPPASGKSTFAKTLADATRWPHLSTDIVRKQLAGLAPMEHAREQHYTPEFSQRTYAALLAQAGAATQAGARAVLLDGNFPTPDHRTAAAAAAHAAGARLAVLFVGVDAGTALRRAEARRNDPSNVSDADTAVTAALRARFVAPTPEEGAALLPLDGSSRPEDLAEECLAWLVADATAATAAGRRR